MPGLRHAAASLRIPDFRRFWIGALVSNTGGWMQRVTVPFVLYGLTGSATWVGFAAFVQFLPVVVLGPVGGSIADRFSRRRVLVVTQAVQALLALALWGLWVTDLATPLSIIAIVAAVGATFGLNGPAWQAFVSELVPRSLLLNAVTLNSTQFNASRAIGPALAGLVLATLGPGWAFLLNAVSFLAVIGALLTIQRDSVPADKPSTRARPLREVRDAMRYARTVPGIVAAYVVVVALGFLGGPIVELLVVFADEVFEVGDTAYGLLGAALGLGAILASPLIAGPGSGVRRSRLVVVAVGAYGGALVAFALAPGYGVGVAALLVAGGGYLALASTLNTTIQTQVDESQRGKVLAVYLMLLTLAMPLGSLLQGWLAEVVGPRVTVAGAGMLFLGVGAWLALGTGMLDHMDDDATAARVAD